MRDPGLTADVHELILHCLPTMQHVDVLLHLHRSAAETRTAGAVATELRAPVAATTGCLEQLAQSGLVARAPGVRAGEPVTYCYQPATPELGEAVDRLASLFLTRPVTLVRTVYERPAMPTPAPPPVVDPDAEPRPTPPTAGA